MLTELALPMVLPLCLCNAYNGDHAIGRWRQFAKGSYGSFCGDIRPGRALVQNNALLLQDAEAIQRQAQASSISFVEQLIASKKMSADVAAFASRVFGYPLLDMGSIDPSQLPKGLVDDELIGSRRLVPLFKRGNKLFIGTSDPTQTSAFHAITFKTGLTVEVVVVEDDKLSKVIGKYTEDATAAIKALGK
jgi:type IV pilus assembly protein PilB